MKIQVNKEVFKKLGSKLKIIILLVEKMDNHNKVKESKHLLKEVEQLVSLTFNKDTLKTHHLISPWVVAQEEFGKKAKHYQTSVERLLKIVLKRKSVSTRNCLTNLLRYVSLKHIIPLGVDDLHKLEGNLTFDVSKGGEKKDVLRNLKAGAIYYYDQKKILGTKLDYWKNSKTSLTSKSTSALIHLEVLPPLTHQKVQEIVQELKGLITSFCGGKITLLKLDHKNNSIKII